MIPAELLTRARSAIGAPTVYHLGSGGMNPDAIAPGVPVSVDGVMHFACDCSGFVCWSLGLSRKTTHPLYVKFNGGWINTDAIVMDVKSPAGFFSDGYELPPIHARLPRVGSLVAFPSKKPERPFGHVGIVSEVSEGKPTKVIHCSHGNFVKFGDAIQETGPEVFDVLDVVFAWYCGLDVEIPT